MSLVAELVLNKWKIQCMHTPETIDKIVMNFRKRGMILETLDYKRINELEAECTITFEDSPVSANRIFANIQRIHDITNVERL